MKILHMLQSDRFSGAENVVCQIITSMRADSDIDFIYCSRDGQIREALAERNITFAPLKEIVFDGYKYTRDEVYEKLKAENIVARKYFYPLINSFDCYKDYDFYGSEKTPVAKYISDRVLTLPMYADLSMEDVDRICEIIIN